MAEQTGLTVVEKLNAAALAVGQIRAAAKQTALEIAQQRQQASEVETGALLPAGQAPLSAVSAPGQST